MRTNCPACNSKEISGKNRVLIAPWVRELTGLLDRSSFYFVCKHCTLGWIKIAYDDKVLTKLYEGYRGAKYLRIRNSWEKTYTSKLNNSLDYDPRFLGSRRDYVTKLISSVDEDFIEESTGVLDIGGGHGGVIPNWENLKYKYVLEVSDAEPKDGVEMITSWDQVPKGVPLNLIMACGILEHLNFPGKFVKELIESSHARDSSYTQYFYFEVPFGVPRLRKNYLYGAIYFATVNKLTWRIFDKFTILKKSTFAPMRIAEHIQFFNEKSISELLALNGYEVITVSRYDSLSSLTDSKGVNFQSGLAALARVRTK
jgi:hypothetical protein